MTNSRSEAIQQITALMAEHGLKPSDLSSVMAGGNGEASASLLQRVMIYIGAAFVFMGICVYVNIIWDDLGSIGRILVTLGSGFIAFILGLMSIKDTRFVKATTPLFLISAALEPTGLFVFMDEYLPHTGDVAKAAAFVFGFMMIQKAVAFSATNRTSLLFFTVFFFVAFLYAVVSWFDLDAPLSVMSMGLSLLMISYGLGKTQHHSIAPFGFFWAGLMVSTASFDILKDTQGDVLMIAVAAGLIWLSTVAASRTLLTVAVISLLAFLGYFTGEYFKNVVGWPIAMIVMGFVMIGTSIFAVKLGRKIAKQDV